MNVKPFHEPNAKAWGLRMLVGPSMVLDGVVHFLSFGCVSLGLSLLTARALSQARFNIKVVA